MGPTPRVYKDGGILMQIFFIKKNQHRITMRMIQEMGREWEGIGRGIRSRPPNIPPKGVFLGGGGAK